MQEKRRLEPRYEPYSNRQVLLLKANLDIGWKNLGEELGGFDEEDRLGYERESTFVCHLRFRHAKEPTAPRVCLQIFPGVEPAEKVEREAFSVEINTHILLLRIPIADQRWVPTNNLSRHPSIYLSEGSLFRIQIEEFLISYDLYAWVRLHGPTKMFVPDKFEWGDGFAWVGGRPESNRRRF